MFGECLQVDSRGLLAMSHASDTCARSSLSYYYYYVFDGRGPTVLIIDDLMSETNQFVANIFTKITMYVT